MLRLPVLSTWCIWGNFTCPSTLHICIELSTSRLICIFHFDTLKTHISKLQTNKSSCTISKFVTRSCRNAEASTPTSWSSEKAAAAASQQTQAGFVRSRLLMVHAPPWFRSHQGIPPGCRHSSLGYYIAQLQGSELWLGGTSQDWGFPKDDFLCVVNCFFL